MPRPKKEYLNYCFCRVLQKQQKSVTHYCASKTARKLQLTHLPNFLSASFPFRATFSRAWLFRDACRVPHLSYSRLIHNDQKLYCFAQCFAHYGNVKMGVWNEYNLLMSAFHIRPATLNHLLQIVCQAAHFRCKTSSKRNISAGGASRKIEPLHSV